MIVCDDQKLIRYCFTGWAGSSHDARVFASSALSRSSRDYFSGNEFLLADSAYPVKEEVVPAYKKPTNGGDLVGDNKVFNNHLANIRVRIEHCIGILKNRFESLKGIRKTIRNKEDVARVCMWIRCCCVLHNLLLQRGEPDDYLPQDINETDDEDSRGSYETATGRDKRERVKEALFQELQ